MKTIEEIREIISTLTLEEKASLCSGETFWLTKRIPGKDIPVIMVSDGPVGLRKQPPVSEWLLLLIKNYTAKWAKLSVKNAEPKTLR